ncbi:MAG TPA: lipoprotein [Geobacteraceae bacterium]
MNFTTTQKIALIISILLLLAGCGRKGKLIPPEALLPAPINDLLVAQKGESFQLSWSIPSREEGGRALKDLAGFQLYKREVLPAEEDCELCPNAYHLLRSIDLAYLQNVRRFGNRLYVNDADVLTNTTYQYKILSVRKDGTPSRSSNKARIRKVVPPPAPRLTARFSVTGVSLQWVAGSMPATVKVLGFNIYRRRGDAPPALLPINDTPMTGSEYEDMRLERGVSYAYSLRTVAEVEGEKVESALSNEVKGTLAAPE